MENVEFNLKITQLYDTVQVRHGIMMVGGTMCGKTSVINVLSEALTILEEFKERIKRKKSKGDFLDLDEIE